MFLVSKAASAGIVLILLTSGVSGPRPTLLPSGANLSKEGSAVGRRTDVKQMQEILHSNGHYSGRVDGVFGPRTRRAFVGFRRLRICQLQGSLICRRPVNSESD